MKTRKQEPPNMTQLILLLVLFAGACKGPGVQAERDARKSASTTASPHPAASIPAEGVAAGTPGVRKVRFRGGETTIESFGGLEKVSVQYDARVGKSWS